MDRLQLEHVIRASADVTGELEIVVVGSQAILGSVPDPPEELTRSMEADVFPKDHPELADQIDGNLGEFSMFHETYGYYAHGVGPETVKGPQGWLDRLVPVTARTLDGRQARGLCLEKHDLVLAKAAAGRERDWEFVEDAMRHALLDPAVLRRRMGMMGQLDPRIAEAVRVGVEQRIKLTGLE